MFNLPDHLTNLVNMYCKEMDAKDVECLISRMRKEQNNPKEVYELKDLEWFPNDKDIKEKAPKEYQDEKKIAMVNKILDDFKNSDSKINNDLKKILDNTDLIIAIRPPDQWENPNGAMVFQKGENGQKDKAVLFVADVLFTEEHKDKLPGLLAHEMGHLLDFKQRPNDKSTKTQYMDGAETFADVSGERIAQNAGYTTLPWAMFMRNASKQGNNPSYSPSGQYRAKTIMRVIRAFNKANRKKEPKTTERIDKSQTKPAKASLKANINALRGLSELIKAPYKPQQFSKVDLLTLKMHQEKTHSH